MIRLFLSKIVGLVVYRLFTVEQEGAVKITIQDKYVICLIWYNEVELHEQKSMLIRFV